MILIPAIDWPWIPFAFVEPDVYGEVRVIWRERLPRIEV
jgi:hypothetical protein